MKTKQLIKEVKSMGFQIKELYSEIVIKDVEGYIVAVASKVEFAALVTEYRGFFKLDYNTKLQLLNLLIKYAKTPIEDRGEEEKFKLKQKGVSEKYLMWMPALNQYITSSKPFSNAVFIFTQSEIDDMPECYTHPAVWEKIKVGCED